MKSNIFQLTMETMDHFLCALHGTRLDLTGERHSNFLRNETKKLNLNSGSLMGEVVQMEPESGSNQNKLFFEEKKKV